MNYFVKLLKASIGFLKLAHDFVFGVFVDGVSLVNKILELKFD